MIDNFDAKELWERSKKIFLSIQNNAEEKNKAERYLDMIISVESKENIFKFSTSNEYVANLLENGYGEKIKECLILAGGRKDITPKFFCDSKYKPEIKIPESKRVAASVNSVNAELFSSTMPLNEDYTFEEFVIGPSNSFATAAAKSVAEKPGRRSYNPLFIHGGTGLGKTHLMQAIGNEIKAKNPSVSVCYLTAEVFLNEFVNALKNDTIQLFRDRYRSIDVLLVDDIQFIAQRKHFQEEFFNTFNSLYGMGKQIVMTSDVAPKKLLNFEERLVSRFEGGMVQEIELPSYETRLAILRKKADGLVPPINDDALCFIAENIKSHVRAMEGALGKINIWLNINPSTIINKEMLYHLLSDFIEKEKNLKSITIEEIQNAICQRYSVTMRQLLSDERTQSIVTPRQLAMYISRKYTTKSLQEIAKMFDKSHATILHGVKNISKRLDVEKDLKYVLEEIISKFGYKLDDKVD